MLGTQELQKNWVGLSVKQKSLDIMSFRESVLNSEYKFTNETKQEMKCQAEGTGCSRDGDMQWSDTFWKWK